MSIRALLIGCGNIGALYDLDDPNRVWTHAKAYSFINDLQLTIFDSDSVKAEKVAAKYNAEIKPRLEATDFSNFDLISISTPTTEHFSFLQKILSHSSSVIICEKPVTNSLADADELVSLYNSSNSKVVVNYMRRFQPAFHELKNKLPDENPQAFIVKYNRGFLNNASHAVDLLEFLFDEQFTFLNFQVQKAEFDSFDYDPTLTGSCLFVDAPASFVGLSDVSYPVFEIEIFYSDSKIVICHSGNEIRYYGTTGKSLQETGRQTNILDKYMMPVVQEALELLSKRKSKDNFLSSLSMNKSMLEIIEPLKIKNATVSN